MCRITTTDGYEGEASTRVDIVRTYSIPTVRIEPDRQTVNQGSSAEVRCIAYGDPAPMITWSKVNEEFSSRISVDGDTLKIDNAQIYDRGMYVCDATSAGGSARAGTVIEVERLEAPIVKMYPETTQSVQRGGSALFQCHLTGGIPSPEITWARADGRPLTPNTETKPGGIIMFDDVTGAEAGSYMCTAINTAGEVKSTAILSIYSPPVITITPNESPIEVMEGTRVRLECSAAGDPLPSVTWSILRANFPTQLQSNSLSPTSAEYVIPSARKDDTGTYKCTATSSAGITDDYIQVFVSGQRPAMRPQPRPTGPSPERTTERPFIVPTARPPVQPTPPVSPVIPSNEVGRVPQGANYEFRCIPLGKSGM